VTALSSGAAVVSDDESLPPHAATKIEAVAAIAAIFHIFFMYLVSLGLWHCKQCRLQNLTRHQTDRIHPKSLFNKE
jgi:hypothetical protein